MTKNFFEVKNVDFSEDYLEDETINISFVSCSSSDFQNYMSTSLYFNKKVYKKTPKQNKYWKIYKILGFIRIITQSQSLKKIRPKVRIFLTKIRLKKLINKLIKYDL